MLAPPDPSSPVSELPDTQSAPTVQTPAPPLPTRPRRTQGQAPELPSSSLPTRPLSSPLLPGLQTADGAAPQPPAPTAVLADPFAPTLPMTQEATCEPFAPPIDEPSTAQDAAPGEPLDLTPQFAAFQTGPRLAERPSPIEAPSAPDAPVGSVAPTLPAAAAALALAAPGQERATAEHSPHDTAMNGYVNRPQELLDMEAESAGEPEPRDESLPDPPAPLLSTGLLGKFVLFAGFAVVPGLFAGDFIGLGFGLASWIALVLWSTLITANARRARPSTLHVQAPRPLSAGVSWFLAPILGAAAFAGLVFMAEWADAASYEEQGSRGLALAAAVCVTVVVMFAAWYRPYALLARTARWVSADGGKARKWFVAPFVAALFAIGLQLLATLLVVADSEVGPEGSVGASSIGAVALIVVSLSLPWIAWLFTGSRAIRAIESGVAHTHSRAVHASRNPEEVSKHVAAYIHGASAPDE